MWRRFCTAALDDIIVTRKAAQRLKELSQKSNVPYRLRIAVEGGGCSGFQYIYELEDKEKHALEEEDRVFTRDESEFVIDETSLDLIRGSTVDFVQELIRSSFAIINNPNAESGCGCGSSFSLKN